MRQDTLWEVTRREKPVNFAFIARSRVCAIMLISEAQEK